MGWRCLIWQGFSGDGCGYQACERTGFGGRTGKADIRGHGPAVCLGKRGEWWAARLAVSLLGADSVGRIAKSVALAVVFQAGPKVPASGERCLQAESRLDLIESVGGENREVGQCMAVVRAGYHDDGGEGPAIAPHFEDVRGGEGICQAPR